VQFRRAAGDVHGRNIRPFDDLHHAVHHVVRHHLGTVRPRVHVAVAAGLIALAADVDLQGIDAGRDQRQQLHGVERLLEAPGKIEPRQCDLLRPGRGQLRMSLLQGR